MIKSIILTYLPMKTQFEIQFWNEFADNLGFKGYKIYHLGDKTFNNKYVKNIYIPRQLDKTFESLEEYYDYNLALHWKNYIDDSFLRESAYYPSILLNGYKKLICIANLIDRLIKNNNVVLVVTWTQTTHVSYLARNIAKYYNIPTYEAERAPFDNFIWIEKEGIFEDSDIKNQYKYNESNLYFEIGANIVEELKNNVNGFRIEKNNRNIKKYKFEKTLFVLVMDSIYGSCWLPQSFSISKKRYKNFDEPCKYINRFQQKVDLWGGELIVKPHPSCKYLYENEININAKIVNDNLKSILSQADYIICNHTKVAFAALALEKKIICTAKNIVLYSGVGNYFSSIEGIKLLDVKNIEDSDKQKINHYFGWLACNYFFTVQNDCGYQSVDEFIKKTGL